MWSSPLISAFYLRASAVPSPGTPRFITFICKACWAGKSLWCSSSITQECICTAIGKCCGKWTCSQVVTFLLSSYLGTLEPGTIWRAADQVDYCLRSAIWWGREPWSHRSPQICQLIAIITQDPQPLHSQMLCCKDGCWRCSTNEGVISGMLTCWQHFDITESQLENQWQGSHLTWYVKVLHLNVQLVQDNKGKYLKE